MPTITLRDIAKALDLSVSTVSKALRDSYEIGGETKKRVIDFAKEHHYFPNRVAKSLKEGKSGSLGVVICSMGNPFVSMMLDGIDGACSKAGYDLIIMQSKESLAQEKSCLVQLEARGVEGILISPSAETTDLTHLATLKQRGIPMVLFDRICEGNEFDQIGIDNQQAAFEGTQHLINNGYRRIGLLNISPGIHFAALRSKGYADALARNRIPYRSDYVRLCTPREGQALNEHVMAHISALLELPEAPDALFTATDQLSTHALSALRQLKKQIPRDLALMGFANTELAGLLTPPLSVVYQPAFEIGKLAAEKLIRHVINQEESLQQPETIRLPVRLDIRESSLPNGRLTR